MLSFIEQLRLTFVEQEWEQIQDTPENPGRGWYRIYTYRIGEKMVPDPVRYAGESLALVLMDISAYRDRDLDEMALKEMRGILASFINLGFDMILRICYDTEGKGMVREPSLFSQVKTHLSQIAPILVEFSEHIFVYQGLLVGNWGEMHESKFLSPKCLQEMASLFLQKTQGKIALSLRKPVHGRMIFTERQILDGAAKKIGFFNDGIFGSETHLGTFLPASAPKGTWQEMWGADDERAFMKPFVEQTPFGGEVLYPSEDLSVEYLENALREMRVSYLNSMHEERMLSAWKKITHAGENYYEHVGKRLGYCFVVQRAEVKFGKQWECTVWVQDIGYGSLYDEAEAILWLERSSIKEQPVRLGVFEGSLRGMAFDETRKLVIRLEKSESLRFDKNMGICLSISLQRKKDQKAIFFSQRSVEGRLLLGEIHRR